MIYSGSAEVVRTGRYCALLEHRMWQTYRRGSSSSYTPLLVSLGACKERSSTVAVEPLRECGLIVSSLAEVI